MLRTIFHIVLISCVIPLNAQWNGVKRYRIKLKQHDRLCIDSLPVVPSSVELPPYTLGVDYRLGADSLHWLSEDMTDSVWLIYRTAQVQLDYRRKDPSIIYEVYEENPFNYVPGAELEPQQAQQLRTFGNISRGIGFGNAQDVVVNSNLNLRIDGKLPNGVDVLAVISDENNPIQPEGNTQQIQDFDQVYITLKKDSTQITVGDFLMQRPKETYFLNYYKRSRGLQFKHVVHQGAWRVQTGAEAAISRGRFSRNRINGIDGNSGPYRLNGTNGEIFIMVIAGTEKVFLDGKQLTRGEGNDYVIDYNSGEITFTPRILITRYSRIVVEFQYSDRNYARTVLRAGGNVSKGNWEVYGHYFSEMDLKSQPFLQSLDGYDSLSGQSAVELLQQVGDQDAAIANVKVSQVFNSDRIMYRRLDSLGTQIYVQTNDPQSDSVFYEVVFSHVGIGNGSYVQVQSSANGKVFEYRGVGLGDYAPVELLASPERISMFTFGTKTSGKTGGSGIELNVSKKDENTFSSIGDEDNTGFGLLFYQTGVHQLRDSSLKITHRVDYEMVSSDFNYVERYRNVEFDRQWNKLLNNPSSLMDQLNRVEHIANFNLSLEKDAFSYLKTRFSTYIRPNHFSGINSKSQMAWKWKNTQLGGGLDWLSSELEQDSFTTRNDFISSQLYLEHQFKYFMVGSRSAWEQSGFRKTVSDSLENGSYQFDQVALYLHSNASKFSYGLQLDQRRDQLPQQAGFDLSTIGRNVQFDLSYEGEKHNRVSLQTIYRKLNIFDSSIEASALDNSIQSRLEWDIRFLKQLFRSKTFLQIGAGQEQRREFQFLSVQAGNGLYIWNDYDSNQVKTLNEFELASDLDRARADHIKIYTPVPGFITTRSQKFSETFEINPAAVFNAAGRKGAMLSRFYSLTSWIMEQKALPGHPFALGSGDELSDSNLIQRSSNLRSSLFFNRSNPKFGAELTYKQNQSKVLLTNGFDSRSARENSLKLRWNLQRKLTLRTTLSTGFKAYISEFFTERSYTFNFWEVRPLIQYQQSNRFRLELKTAYYTALNDRSKGGESTLNLEVGAGFKYTRPGKGAFKAEASYVKVDFDGQANSSLGYELLRGLQDGNNATWSVSFQQKLGGNIQLLISYDGRKSEDAPVIHLGRMVARYLF